MKKLLFTITTLSLILLPGMVLAGQKNSPSHDPTFLKWNKKLNEVWRDDFSEEDRERYKPTQNRWIEYRDKKCLSKGKCKDQCLVDETYLRIQELWDISTNGEANDDDFSPTQLQRDCVAGGGGLACYDKW